MPYWDRPAYPTYGYHQPAQPYKYASPHYGNHYVDPPPRPATPATPAHPYYVYSYPTYIPFNVNYGNPTLPSDYADLLEVALATNLSKLTVRFQRAMDELYQHYRFLRGGAPNASQDCRLRCQQLYERCLRSAVNGWQQRECYTLYQRCLALCSSLKL